MAASHRPIAAVLCLSATLATGPSFHASAADAARGAVQLEKFKGVTTNGTVLPDLFPIRATGVSTAPMRTAAHEFIAALDTAQRRRTLFDIDDDEWRLWNNVHRYTRQGVSFLELNEAQRAAAWRLLAASLSARGLETSRNIMRLNGHLADVLNRHDEYGEHLYWLTIMGQPSDTQPWGWQLDGHHLIIN